jgi:alpha-L-fucosidase 2
MSVNIFPLFAVTILFIGCTQQPEKTAAQELQLMYYKPALLWEETLPLGNGRIGMMPDGGVDKEQIVLKILFQKVCLYL